jgi:L-fuconolactonase
MSGARRRRYWFPKARNVIRRAGPPSPNSGYRTSGPEEMRPIGESEFVHAIAEESDRRGSKTKICAGIVSFADLRLPSVDAVLEGQIAAAGGRFRGIRQIAAHDPAIIGASSYVPPPGLTDDPNFRRGLKRLPAHNLTFEAWIYHPQIKTLTEVACEWPEVKIVLNHFGGPLGVGPYKRDEVFPGWRADIKELSACPNAYVKLCGLAMIVNGFDFHLAPLPPSSDEMANAWRPYVETCVENFGANRCKFESNFPVDKGACSYPVLFNAFKRLASGASASEKADLFTGTAARFYRPGN